MADYPKVTENDLLNNIAHTEIVEHETHGGQILRWAILTTLSGFAVTGDPSASVCRENDDPDLGAEIATRNARNKLWQMMGYALKERLFLSNSSE